MGRRSGVGLAVLGIALIALALCVNAVAGLRGTWQPDEACLHESGGGPVDRWLLPASALCWNGAQLVSHDVTLATVVLASAGVGLVSAVLARALQRSFWGAGILAAGVTAVVLVASYTAHALLFADGAGVHPQP